MPKQMTDAEIDVWNAAAIDGCRGVPPKSETALYMDGYREGQNARRVSVVMPERPEGYYHMPVGTFD